MNTYVMLLRGINVGGRHSLPMKELRELLEDLGCRDVRTYIQSGNVVLQSPAKLALHLGERTRTAIGKHRGFVPDIRLLSLEAFSAAIDSNPYPEAEADPKALHVGFLDRVPPNPDLEAIDRLRAKRERFYLDGSVVYLYAPDGIGRSKLAEKLEKFLGVSMTGRNWRTVCQIRDLMEEAT
jgi:uncharacterized protein (DUF1697 family)